MPRAIPLLLLAFSVAWTLGGCAERYAPPRPAMVAFGSVGDFGYSETRLADDRYQVRYVEPRLRVSTNKTERDTAIAAAKQRSYDLALWRAAQLAVDRGFAALSVVQDRRDADVDVTTRRVYGASPFVGFGYYGSPGWDHGPWFPYHYGYPYYPYYPYERASASARVSVMLQVRFLRTAGDGAVDAAATIETMQRRYAGATFPPAD
jgi:hypothetical protein